MSKARYLVGLLCLATAAAVWAEGGGDVQKAIEEAKAAYEKADSVQGAWINTPKLIEQAEEAAAKGDTPNALKHAAAAKKEAEASYAQAVEQQENWSPPPYLR